MFSRFGRVREKGTDYLELARIRLSFLVLISALIPFWLASREALVLYSLMPFIAGAFLIIASANVLNQLIERDVDALMDRTANRPLPGGRVEVWEALLLGLFSAFIGTVILWLLVNGLTAVLALVALVIYIFAYTPLKRRSAWCTMVGAISGAIPPLMGWTAVRNELSPPAFVLAAILFFWQFPHFWAISWMYRDEYDRAGFQVLPVLDATGFRTARHVMMSCVALIGVSLILPFLGVVGPMYLFGAILVGLCFLYFCVKLWQERSRRAASHLMRASIIYLPLLFALMVFDRVSL